MNRVSIKFYSDGLVLQCKEEADFEEILSEVKEKFTTGKKFFGKATVSIEFRGKELSDQEKNLILQAITDCSDVVVIAIIGNESLEAEMFRKQLEEHNELREKYQDEVKPILFKSLQKGEMFHHYGNMVLVGNIAKESSLILEKGFVIVLGKLEGKVIIKEKEKAFIAALEMSPTELEIGDFKYIPKEKGFFRKNKSAQIARATEEDIKLQAFSISTMKRLL